MTDFKYKLPLIEVIQSKPPVVIQDRLQILLLGVSIGFVKRNSSYW